MNKTKVREKSSFTPEQRCAIYTKGSDILVSAGAGSGKTKVLTQRIYVKLLQGVDISNLLVLTFTNAAAAEMKTRLKDKIKYALEPKPKKDKPGEFDEPTLQKDLDSIVADDEDFPNPEDKIFKDPTVVDNIETFKDILKDQYNKIDSALVTTFDSFALGVIKKYHYEFGVDRNVKIANDNVLALKKAVIMDEVFEGLYQEGNEAFEKLLEIYTHKSDSEIRKTLVKLADKVKKYLRNGCDDEIFKSYKDLYYNDAIIHQYISEYEKIINQELNSVVGNAVNGADIYQQKKAVIDTKFFTKGKLSKTDNDNRKKYIAKITLMDGYANFFNTVRSYDEIIGFYNTNEPQKTNRYYDEEVNIFLKKYKDIRKKYLVYASVSKIKESINGSLETIGIIVEILKRYFSKYDQFKKDLGVYEFDDVSKNVLKKFKEWDKEIESNPNAMNPLIELRSSFEEILLDEYQDTSDIQEDFMKYIKQDNMYMVGDMKQSIYRFRDANPYLFKDKYNNYAVHNGERVINKPTRINLTFNFRSRKEVLDNINLMFDNLMSDDCGDADYQNGHRMVYGRKKYDETIVPNFDYNQEYLYYQQEENSEYDALKLEAYIVAKKIKELMNPDMKVVDKENDTFNKIQYSDFAVIIPRIDTARYYQEVFEELKIPYNLKVSEKIKDCKLFVVIISLINLIKIIDSYEQVKAKQCKNEKDKEIIDDFKYYFMSVARSFLFNIEDGKLLEYMLKGLETSEVYKKASKISEYSKNHSITNTFEEMVKEFKFYESFVRIGDVDKYLYVLDYLQKTVSDLSSLGYDFGDIAEHFEKVKEKDIETKIDNTIDKNAVIIVNIHKSKGLEYPICFFTDLDARFNTSDVEANFIFSKNHGFIAPYFENGRFETLAKIFFKDKYLKEDISEHVRLFYVALTRAREKMYFVVPEPQPKKNDDDEEDEHFNSYTSFIETYFEQAVKDYKQLISEDEIVEFVKSAKCNIDEIDESSSSKEPEEKDTENNPYSLEHKPWKFEKTSIDFGRMSMEINELIPEKVASNLETGNRLHEILQSLNLVEVSRDNSVVDSLKISPSDAGIIKNILNLPCFSKLENAQIYKEFEFVYNEEIEQDGNTIIKTRHGIIDLLVEYDDHFDIIDYKTNNIDKEEYEVQLNGYRKYLEEIIRNSGEKKYIKMYLVSLVQCKQKEVSVL